MSHFLSHCNQCDKNYPADLPKCPKCGNWVDISPTPLDPRDWGYDIETYPNCFTATWIHAVTGLTIVHEISDRRNDWSACVEFMYNLGRSGARGVGFNNLYFDYPVLHWLAGNPGCDARAIYDKAMSIIKGGDRWGSQVWDSDQIFPQLDLFKICHFDNKAKSTSLKALEIVMRSRNVIDLPFPVGTMLTSEQIDVLLRYNLHDVRETLKFYVRILSEIHLRERLSEKYCINMLNYSNTKIGATILTTQMEQAGLQCYDRGPEGRVPRQTIRDRVAFKDVIFPYVKFERPEFNEVLEKFKAKAITSAEIDAEMSGKLTTKGVFTDLNCTVDGFTFVFGVGGIHGSVESQVVCSDEDNLIEDADVTSFYPKTAIVNGMYPEHLGPVFCQIYNGIFDERASYPKGTPENRALKEALNASYGNSNNKFSPLFDPKYTMQTTINGQLMLCMLAEQLMKIPDFMMIQANTDGITYRCPRKYLEHARKVCEWWEGLTGLELEYAHYSRMMIRDVNNYIAEYEGSGKLKRKGAYEYEYLWHQDPSATVVGMAAEAALVRGVPVRDFIINHRDPFDFMLRGKVKRSDSLFMVWSEFGVEIELQGTTRYFISHNGGELVKKSPPKGTPGQWKRKNKLTDDYYQVVLDELANVGGTVVHHPDRMGEFPEGRRRTAAAMRPFQERWELHKADGTVVECDSTGRQWDERINTKNRSTYDQFTVERINSGWRVTECADAALFDWGSLNYEWYIEQASKLVDPLVKVG